MGDDGIKWGLLIWWIPSLLPALLGFALHLPALDNPLVWDDRAAVAYNRDVLGETNLLQLFNNDFWGQSMSLNDSHKSYRPLAVLSLRLNHSYHGLDPYGYHVVNIVLHCMCIVLVSVLVRLLIDVPSTPGSPYDKSRNKQNGFNISLIAGFMFACHPVHTEVVASVVGRADLLCSVFALSSIVIYTIASSWNTSRCSNTHWLLISCAYFLAVLATFSKEVGITTFVMLISFELIEACIKTVYDQSKMKMNTTKKVLEKVIPHTSESSDKTTNILMRTISIINSSLRRIIGDKQCLLKVVLPIVHLIGVLVLHLSLHGDQMLRTWSILENDIAVIEDGTSRKLSFAWVNVRYCLKLVFPYWPGMCYDHGYPCIYHVTDLGEWRALVAILFHVLVLLGVCMTISSCWHQTPSSITKSPIYPSTASPTSKATYRLELWCIAFLILPFLPASQLFFPIGTTLGERLLYLPSVGHCILLALMMDNVADQVLSSYYTFGDIEQIEQIISSSSSKSGSSKKNMKKSKDNSPPSYCGFTSFRMLALFLKCFCAVFYMASLGSMTYLRLLDWHSELSLFESALKVCPLSLKVQSNLALTLMDVADSLSSSENSQAKISIGRLNSGARSTKQEREYLLSRAAALLDSALDIHPYFDAAVLNRGLLHLKKEEHLQASHLFARVLKIEPFNQKARCLLGRTHLLLGLSLRESIERGQVEAPDVKEVEAFIRSASELSTHAIQHGCQLPLCYWTAGAALAEFGDHGNAAPLLMSATSLNRGGGDLDGLAVSSLTGATTTSESKDKLDPTAEQSVLNLLGISLRAIGNSAGAVAAFDAGVQLKGASTHELLANSAELFADIGDFDSANERYMLAIDLSPNNAEVINNHGFLLEKEGRYVEAAQRYKLALQLLAPHGHPQIETNLRLIQAKIGPSSPSLKDEL